MTISASCASDYFEINTLNMVFRNTSFSPCPVWLALWQGARTTASALEQNIASWWNTPEVSGNGYERVSPSGVLLVSDTTSYTSDQFVVETGQVPIIELPWVVENGKAYNRYEIQFPTATGQWSDVGWVLFMSGSHNSSYQNSGSRIYMYAVNTGASQVQNGEVFAIPRGELTVEFANDMDDSLANALLNYYLNNIEFERPRLSIYAALYNILPDNFSSNEASREVSGSTGYIRRRISGKSSYRNTIADSGWSAPSGSISASIATSSSIVFTSSADSEWGKIDGLALVVSNSDNPDYDVTQILYKQKFDNPPFIQEGDGFKINAGDLKVFFDDDD